MRLIALDCSSQFIRQIGNSYQDLQNRLFTTFLYVFVAPGVIAQVQPHFIGHRMIFEAREKKARIYSWTVFVFSEIVCEIPYLLVSISFILSSLNVCETTTDVPCAIFHIVYARFAPFSIGHAGGPLLVFVSTMRTCSRMIVLFSDDRVKTDTLVLPFPSFCPFPPKRISQV